MGKVCHGCGYERKETDEIVPDWECPSCGYAYNKTEAKLARGKHRSAPAPSNGHFFKSKLFWYGVFLTLAISTLYLLSTSDLVSKKTTPNVEQPPSLPQNVSSRSDTNEQSQHVESSARKVVQVDDAERSRIKVAIAEVENRVSALDVEIGKYQGGLVLSVLLSAQAIEKQTLAMLKQKQASWFHAINLNYEIDGEIYRVAPDLKSQITTVESEIRSLESDIETSHQEADRYSGGLIRATLLSTNATQQQTLAMLQQKRVALMFDLPQYIGFQKAASSVKTATQQPPALEEKVDFEIMSIDAKVTETNSTWWKFAWRLQIKNNSKSVQVFNATIEFLDSEGFVVDDGQENGLVVQSGETKSFTGYELVTASVARNINSTSAKVRLR
ncbi:hypothetical protein [Pseudoalteromonas sp. T1lg22]|uniref:hypothetical protein n=1 Tax=Pseudoalteromonas sp. T1lg22 TaxID=2077096 RepID=UPI000CF67DF0|nr:hypothetical protein [Pseudoalteromonas sp. T1lg22]